MSGTRILLLAAAVALTLSACDNGPSAVAQKPANGTQVATGAGEESFAGGSSPDQPQVDRRREPVKLVDGKPMWSASRKYSADENARRAFDRNGRDFGARDIDAFIQKAHDFVGSPPKGTLTMTRRNGDTLFYDPKDNVFAVASKEGAPRTMFHPDEGRAYWEEQKAREQKRQSASSRRDRDDDA